MIEQLLEHLLTEQEILVNELTGKTFKGLAAAGLIGSAGLLGGLQDTTSAASTDYVKNTDRPVYSEPLNKDTSNHKTAEVSIDMKKIIEIESSGNPHAVNKHSGARGLCQLMKGTWYECTERLKKDWGWDEAFDGRKNLTVGTYYMNKRIPQMLRYYKLPDTIETRLSAYNWGIGFTKKAYKKYGKNWIKHIPTETRNYIKRYYNE